jgi:hypothetical protein
MDYPDTLSLKILESTHPEYAAIAPIWQKIDDLAAGGNQLERKKAHYLKSRPGEEEDLYKLRLERFTYTNQLGGAIAQQVSKLSSGTLSVSNLPETDFWNQFREDTGGDRDERTLISDVFRTALKFRRAFLHADKPYSEIQPQTKGQEEELRLNPYLCLYNPLQVRNWGFNEQANEYEWLKIRQIATKTSPMQANQTKATWTLIDETHIARYEALVKLGKGGKIVEIVNERGEAVDSGDDAKIARTRWVPHGAGALPVVVFELPEDLWVTNQCYLKALEHLNLENSRYDTAMMVGYVQRTWKPVFQPDGDLDATYVDVDDEQFKTGNQYVLKGDFGFSEAAGSSIATVSSLLEEIRNYINDCIGMARASASRGAVEQSGISKKMDFVISELVLRAYGQLLCACYQDVLQLVGKLAGEANTEQYSVTGLDSFDVDSLETTMAIAAELRNVIELVPPTALKLFYAQLANLLVKNASAEQQQDIQAELDRIFGARQE